MIVMKKFQLISIAICAILSSACADRSLRLDTPYDGTEVSVGLDISVLPDQGVSPTKLGYSEPSVSESTDVKNLWVLQFDGIEEDSRLVRYTYYESFQPSSQVKLVSSTAENRLVFLANTFDRNTEVGSVRKYKDVKNLYNKVYHDCDAGGVIVGGKRALKMNARADVVVQDGMTIPVPLKRTSARIDVTVTNNLPGLVIDSISVCSALLEQYLFTDYDMPNKFPASFNKIDFPATPWSDGTDVAGGRAFTFYVPANKRGESGIDDPVHKSWTSPDGVGYVRIVGDYTESGQTRTVAYRFRLGSDLDHDCNLLPNHRYSYSFVIDGKGDYSDDSRVLNLEMQDYTNTELANCYMVSPPEVAWVWKHVRVPIRRVHDFWNTTDGYEKVINNALEQNSFGWKVDVLRSSYELTEDENFKWIKRTGDTYDDYFEFAIRSNPKVPAGNIIIGIHRFTDRERTTVDDVFIWSWHFWITDYDPEVKKYYTPEFDSQGVESRFEYYVDGGSVYRFPGGDWDQGKPLSEAFIMDRELGTTDVNATTGPGVLFYQHGRKDPFNYNCSYYNIYPNHDYVVIKNEVEEDRVKYSINYPYRILSAVNSYWCNSDTDSDGNIYQKGVWHDPKVSSVYEKSIFDPCPPGWHVCSSTAFKPIANKYKSGVYNPSPDVRIYFPIRGYLNIGTGNPTFTSTRGYLWMCEVFARQNFSFVDAQTGGSGYTTCSTAMQVRCISYRN